MNAKKETAYMFADGLTALHELAPDAPIVYSVNLEMRGLPKVRRDAERIIADLDATGLSYVKQGALDEYGATGDMLGRWIQDENPDFAFITGVPHAIPENTPMGSSVFSDKRSPPGCTTQGSGT